MALYFFPTNNVNIKMAETKNKIQTFFNSMSNKEKKISGKIGTNKQKRETRRTNNEKIEKIIEKMRHTKEQAKINNLYKQIALVIGLGSFSRRWIRKLLKRKKKTKKKKKI